MSTTTIEREILGLENQYWQAMRENDVDAAVALTRFPCTVAGPQGAMRVEEDEYRKMMKSHDGNQFRGIDLEEPKVDVLNDQTAIITYSIQSNSMKMLDVSTWIREGNQWKCAFHSENPEQKEMPKH